MRTILHTTGLLLQIALTTTFVLADSPSSYDSTQGLDTITRDVAIIGGGSTGTYAAFKLLDQNRTVVVIEAKDRLGGHTETYHDPVTGGTVDYGVVVFHDLDTVRNYFARFNVGLINTSLIPAGNSTTTYVNLATGQLATSYVPPAPEALGAALQTYGGLLSQYAYVQSGFNLPNPVPEDLVIPFGQFMEKYNLQALAQLIFFTSQGLGDILSIPTIYVMQNFGLDLLRSFQVGFLTTARGDNSELYEKATAELASKNSVLLNSTVLHADRNLRDTDGYLSLLVKTGSSPTPKLIRAKQVLITIPPTVKNLTPFNLNPTERSIFSKFNSASYLTGILKNSGVPPSTNLNNVNPCQLYNLPNLPSPYGFFESPVPGLTQVKYAGPENVSVKAAKKDILDTLDRLKQNGVIPSGGAAEPEFVAFSDHSPFELRVGRADIESGFYTSLYGLQGVRGTWWTGAAWLTQDSSVLWQFTEGVVQRLVQSL